MSNTALPQASGRPSENQIDPVVTPQRSTLTPLVTRLSARDLEEVCKAIGVFKRNGDANRNNPTSTIWPPKGLDEGLYKDVITSRCKSQYTYHVVSSLLHTSLILQLILGATLTALGSTSKKNGTVITILAVRKFPSNSFSSRTEV
ncbi:hypothetical protein DL95DRAFT_449974 [Leptodontidium sp. 2 PMI_412]|nr:hypothetical protein DL95DRAFT_449974 [Leptodontidium sp. 2 PMI_412]